MKKYFRVMISLSLLVIGLLLFSPKHEIELIELSDRASYLTTTHSLDKPAAIAVEKLIADAESEGICLVVTGSYRSVEYQQKLIESAKPEDRDKYALPGKSEHHSGLAVDFGGCPMTEGKRDATAERLELRKDFEELPEYAWLLKNAGEYSFYESYREDNQSKTGLPPEPWHWKYKL